MMIRRFSRLIVGLLAIAGHALARGMFGLVVVPRLRRRH